MTVETQDDGVAEAKQTMDRSADEMQDRVETLDDHISETKENFDQAKRGSLVPTAAGDWEDTDDNAGGDDASSFDDPEVEEEEEEDEPA